MSDLPRIRIDQMVPVSALSRLHIAPVMKDGQSGYITIGQIIDLLVAGAPVTLDTWLELVDHIQDNEDGIAALVAAIALKANKTDIDIHALTAKAALVDADQFRLSDSEAAWGFKSVTLANLVTSIFKTARKIANGYFLSSFRLWDATDNTKGLGWVLSGIATATTRLITMADRDVNLANVPTPWVSYTPTFNGIGAPTSVQARSRRVGACLEVEATWTNGTATGTTFDMSLGFNGVNGGVVCDTFWNTRRPVCGTGVTDVTGATTLYVLGLGGSNVVNISFPTTGRNGLTPVAGSVLGTAAVLMVRFSIPIDGWNV